MSFTTQKLNIHYLCTDCLFDLRFMHEMSIEAFSLMMKISLLIDSDMMKIRI